MLSLESHSLLYFSLPDCCRDPLVWQYFAAGRTNHRQYQLEQQLTTVGMHSAWEGAIYRSRGQNHRCIGLFPFTPSPLSLGYEELQTNGNGITFQNKTLKIGTSREAERSKNFVPLPVRKNPGRTLFCVCVRCVRLYGTYTASVSQDPGSINSHIQRDFSLREQSRWLDRSIHQG